MDDRWLPSGTTRLPTEQWAPDGRLIYQVRVEQWLTENCPERATEDRAFWSRIREATSHGPRFS